jgi:hypothetical protein
MAPYKPIGTDGEQVNIPQDIDEKLINSLIFAAIWGIGGCLNEHTSGKYDVFLAELISGVDVITQYNLDMGPDFENKYPVMKIPNKIGEFKSLYDL